MRPTDDTVRLDLPTGELISGGPQQSPASGPDPQGPVQQRPGDDGRDGVRIPALAGTGAAMDGAADTPVRRHRRAAAVDGVSATDRASTGSAAALGRVLVIGSATALGRAIAHELASLGYRLVLHHAGDPGTGGSGLPGGPHLTMTADVTDPREVDRLFDDATAGSGPVESVVIALAAEGSAPELEGSTSTEWADAWVARLSVQVLGAALVAHAAVRGFATRRGGGRLILIDPAGDSAVERAVSQAVRGLAAGIAADPAAQRCGVCVVGSADSSAEQVAASVAWLASAPTGAGLGGVFSVGG